MNKTLAALSFFTRLPFWRLRDIPAESYKRVVELWPLAGWLTGGIAGGVFFLAGSVLPAMVAAALAITSRLLLTGALHEDGLADFFDGFGGGGKDRSRILAIMKDSRIGSYGVIALVMYFIVWVSTVASMPGITGALAILVTDTWSKSCSAFIIDFLPYARTAETSKNKLVYNPLPVPSALLCLLIGVFPMLLFLKPIAMLAGIAPICTTAIMVIWLRNRLGGYTGDCCGALFVMSELSMLVVLSAMAGSEQLPLVTAHSALLRLLPS
ncbi:MAG: adenosylcobinamide-GDP ribazoletransferase [Bacteroides sp.]|nr:adenosylcobinamide-GDP ribazoletransferase [Bacteroides sp.]